MATKRMGAVCYALRVVGGQLHQFQRGREGRGLCLSAVCLLALAAPALAEAGAPGPAGAPAPLEHVERLAHDPGSGTPAIGPLGAPVQVEFFFLPGPGNSRLPYQLIWDLWQRHPTRIRVTFRVLSRQGQIYLPTAALEAAAQGKFAEFMAAVHGRLRTNAPEQISQIADSVGMDLGRLTAAWADWRHSRVLEDNEHRRVRMRVRQLPEALFSGKLAARPISVLGPSDLEAAYREAYARAQDQLDRGVDPANLHATLEAAALAERSLGQVSLGPADERLDEEDRFDSAFALLDRPIDLRGLPTVIGPAPGPRPAPRWISPEEPAPVPAVHPILVACNPLSILCYRQLQLAPAAAAAFDGGVRVVWSPMFDLRARDAATVARVADAVLCAEAMGVGGGALDLVVTQTNRRRGRMQEADQLIDALIAEADLDRGTMASCLAINAGAAVRRTLQLRRAGMALSPTVVVGGRMYPGGMSDSASLQSVVEEQLAPGWLGQFSVEPARDRTPAPGARR